MIGVQDFCGHYDWTFEYIRRTFGEDALQRYWAEAIAFDSQSHAFDLIARKGFEGMAEYWGHTLTQEEAGYAIARTEDAFRIDMHECPSKGFLIQNGLEAYHDYCAHCMGWIAPVAQRAGFTIDHEHNHCGQCWWELRRAGTQRTDGAAQAAGERNVDERADWNRGEHHVYRDCRLAEGRSVGEEEGPE
ncbi:MAG: hypothetical protein FJY92_05705 [Candidatus Hydrogenedentes bacterium]|nr:hypothetical protein [Candidatus Hydrogenedentota bacterium]